MSYKKLVLDFNDEHNRLVDLFNEYREVKKIDLLKAKEIFMDFSDTLQKHMLWEERVLFPILRGNNNISHEHTLELIIREHLKILSDLKQLHKKLENNVAADKEEEKLIIDLLKHEEFEDEVFHPAIIRLLRGEFDEDTE